MDELIEFKDFPNIETPINAENLNSNFTFLQEKNDNINKTVTQINSDLNKVKSTSLGVTKNVEEQTLLETNIENEGIYLFFGNIPVNYRAQENRHIDIRFYVNEINVDFTTAVLNLNAYTVPRTLFTITDVPANSTIRVGIKSSTVAEYSCGEFNLTILRLK